MNADATEEQRMSVPTFFAALASNKDFVFAVAYTNSFKKNHYCKRTGKVQSYKKNLIINLLSFASYMSVT
jgi:hypothetical protein